MPAVIHWVRYLDRADQGLIQWENTPDNKIHGANMGPIWGRQDPGGPRVGPMNFAIWGDPYAPPSHWDPLRPYGSNTSFGQHWLA